MKKILFVGNSYTYYNDMPQQIFAKKAASAGLELEVTAVTRGGWTLEKFADPENEEGQRLRSVIAGQHYDYVILQEQSCRPVTDPEKFYAAVRDLQTLLAAQAERFFLYATWGRKPGNEKLAELGLTNEEMTERLAESYDEAGRRSGMPVAHAGHAFAAYRAAHPEEELYNPDGSHPSLLGSEIAAETILTAILNATTGEESQS